MSFGLGRGRALDPGEAGLTLDDLPPLPDDLSDPRGAWIDPRRWFERPEARFEIEIGSGKGTFLLEEGARRPEVNFLGIEHAREFFLYAADRVRRRGLANVRLLYADAAAFLRHRTPDAIASVIHLYFPDPWPKSRHHKRRMVQDAFLAEALRVLEPGGELRIVTDHDDYWEWMEGFFARWCVASGGGVGAGVSEARFDRLEFSSERRASGASAGELVGTNFERKYAREGRPFHAAVLRKPAGGGGEGPVGPACG